MNKFQKIFWAVLLLAGLVIINFTGCMSTPHAWETKFFDIETNTVPQIVLKTNQVYQTNIVERTDVQTNWVAGIPEVKLLPVKETVITSEAHVTVSTNFDVTYTYHANTNASAIGQTAGNIANLVAPGSGGIVTTALAGLAALWAGLRSRKLKKTAGVLAQGIEIYGEVTKSIGTTGASVDRNVKQLLQKHQVEAGVVDEVLRLIDKNVDNSDAKEAADALKQLAE